MVQISETKLTARQCTLIIFYRLTIHPLAKYPGPLLGRITNLYAVYHAYVGDIHLDMLSCHDLYGEAMLLPQFSAGSWTKFGYSRANTVYSR